MNKMNVLPLYNALNWEIVSGDMSWNAATEKKVFTFHSSSWRDAPVCREGATGYALKTGSCSGVMAIDLDDPNLQHNRQIADMCEKAGAIKQVTRKGTHYLFKASSELRTTTNKKLALDIRNENALLYIEPSHYVVGNRTHYYKFSNLPDTPDAIPECPQDILDYIHRLFTPNLDTEKMKRIKETVKRENREMDKTKCTISKKQEDIRKLLMAINLEHAEEYSDWIKVGLALYHEQLPWELFDEFSRRSPKYREGEPFYVYTSFHHHQINEPISLRTLYWWCKQENPEVFKTLINQDDNEEYLAMKEEFEKTNFLVGSRIVHLHDDGTQSFMTDNEARVRFANREFRVWDGDKVKKQSFYLIWLHDPNRREYDRMDFIPPPRECPANVYNLFTGLAGAQLPELDLTQEERMALIQPILTHISKLTSGQPEFMVHIFAQMVQQPGIKPGVSVVLRDMYKMLSKDGGTGKNALIEFFGDRILGEKYVAVLATNASLYDAFNEHLEHKLLVYVEEARGKDNAREIDQLKAAVTGTKRLVNRKGVPKYTQRDFARYIFTTNNPNPIANHGATPGDRRFWFADVDTAHRDQPDYFPRLWGAMERKDVQRAFYDYLLAFPCYTSPFEFQNKRPITPAFIDLRRMNAGMILRWVIDRVESEMPIDDRTSTLFADFTNWMRERNERKDEDNHISLTAFTQYLTRNKTLVLPNDPQDEREGRYKSSVSYLRLDTARLRRALIENHYVYRLTPAETAEYIFGDE